MSTEAKSEKELQYWMQEGPKTAAFLLVIPGLALFGSALGWVEGSPVPYGLMGLGLGMFAWGLIVVFRTAVPMP